ncbi:hypothetical protein KFL_002280060 [Klebsormidium nitens]|uniref:Uncharacterized protein n=1 Tax=Klebsormidium nitens TaxID=105231 RepID=A0A1Y1I5R1_KLENI|nr:hypothetical protein KFL_002280060 [Klebsormidium nitens]|eukprot:GAQ85292.1 hypothetical protein KFL_002280060 [Klebsormidium nitens]
MTDERASPVVIRERPRSATRAPSAPGPLVAESSAGSLRAANPNPNPRVLVVPAFREASYQERRGWEAAWQSVKKACEDMLGSLGEAVQQWKQEMSPRRAAQSPQISDTTRKIQAKRILARMEKAHREMLAMQADMSELSLGTQRLQSMLAKAQKSRAEALSKVDQLAAEKEETEGKLGEANERIGELEVELKEARGTAERARFEARQTEQSSEERDRELQGARQEIASLGEERAALRESNERLRAEREAAVTDMERKERERSDAARIAEDAADTAGRYKEAVARLTADNMIFLMKLRTAEAQLSAADKERTELRTVVEMKQGEWLDRARAQVEERVKESLRKAEQSEKQLQRARAEAAEEARQAAVDLARVKADLDLERERRRECSDELEDTKVRLAGAEERLRFLDAQSTQDQLARQDAQAETRVLRAEVDSLRRHVAALEEQLEGSRSEVQRLTNTVASQVEEVRKLSGEVETLAASLTKQQAVNEGVMKKKEQVEWQLLELQAECQELKRTTATT